MNQVEIASMATFSLVGIAMVYMFFGGLVKDGMVRKHVQILATLSSISICFLIWSMIMTSVTYDSLIIDSEGYKYGYSDAVNAPNIELYSNCTDYISRNIDESGSNHGEKPSKTYCYCKGYLDGYSEGVDKVFENDIENKTG